MNISHKWCWFTALTAFLLIQGCAATAPNPYDYSAYRANMPRSILVLPPVNETTEVMAPYIYLSTITRVLAEKGYYVYPVAVIDAMMKENGVPTPEEMAQISLKKIGEVINPDAVLYVTIVEWGSKYQIIDTTSLVRIRCRLVDTDTGTLLWQGEETAAENSNAGGNGGGILGMMIEAVVEKVVSNISDPTRELSYQANWTLFNQSHKGLLVGERHPGFADAQKVDGKKAP